MAQVCAPEPLSGDDYTYYVASQSTLDTIASKCTSINGSILISYNYTVNSISLPDLEHIDGNLDLQYLYDLRNISAPKLGMVGHSVYVDYAYNVDLRSLQNAEHVLIYGNLSSLRLDSLKSVHQTLGICNKDGCSSSLSPVSAIELSLLSLKSVGYIDLEGRISTLSTPELTSVAGKQGSPAWDSTEGFQVTTGGVIGNIVSLSMPDMIGTNITLTVNAVNLPNLRRAFNGIYIYSDMDLDCDAIQEAIFRNVSIWNGSRTCSAKKAESESHGLSASAKAGIGIGSGIAGIIVFVLIPLYILHREREKKGLKTVSEVELMPPSYQAALQDRASLPEYSPGEHGHVASPREP
ncbi:hypothetical protein BDW66DRAFT_157565 [Aspergillus desertorum]